MNRYSEKLLLVLLLALPATGICSAPDQQKDLLKADAAAPAGAKDAAKPAMGKDVVNGVNGKVVETMSAGGYTYVNLEKDGVKGWAAFPEMKFAIGQEVSAVDCSPMMGFQSKALNRNFDKIMFCNSPLTAAETELLKKKSTGSNVAVPEPTEKIVVEKAKGENVYSIEECFAKSAKLNGKKVTVRGKVLKVSSGIMGNNWLHLQDGTGSATKKTNNLVVTSKESAKAGDTVTITGTLAKDKDFGSGYKYSVIVEQATVKK